MAAEPRPGEVGMSVILPIRLSGEHVNALLDSGASPSVIDRRTVHDLGLEQFIDVREGEVFAKYRL